jgi:hypothetical protein
MWISANLGAESLTRALFLCQLGLGCLDTLWGRKIGVATGS